jgi:hypothetical protein
LAYKNTQCVILPSINFADIEKEYGVAIDTARQLFIIIFAPSFCEDRDRLNFLNNPDFSARKSALYKLRAAMSSRNGAFAPDRMNTVIAAALTPLAMLLQNNESVSAKGHPAFSNMPAGVFGIEIVPDNISIVDIKSLTVFHRDRPFLQTKASPGAEDFVLRDEDTVLTALVQPSGTATSLAVVEAVTVLVKKNESPLSYTKPPVPHKRPASTGDSRRGGSRKVAKVDLAKRVPKQLPKKRGGEQQASGSGTTKAATKARGGAKPPAGGKTEPKPSRVDAGASGSKISRDPSVTVVNSTTTPETSMTSEQITTLANAIAVKVTAQIPLPTETATIATAVEQAMAPISRSIAAMEETLTNSMLVNQQALTERVNKLEKFILEKIVDRFVADGSNANTSAAVSPPPQNSVPAIDLHTLLAQVLSNQAPARGAANTPPPPAPQQPLPAAQHGSFHGGGGGGYYGAQSPFSGYQGGRPY